MDLHPVPGLHGPRTADNDLCIGVQRTTDGGGGIARFHHRDRQRYYDILLTQDCGFLFDSQHIAAGIIFMYRAGRQHTGPLSPCTVADALAAPAHHAPFGQGAFCCNGAVFIRGRKALHGGITACAALAQVQYSAN